MASFTGTLFAQDFASLTITVTDSTDAAVPDASVTLVNSQRGTIVHQQTPTGGYVIFDSLTPGDYSVTVEKTGFRKYVIEDVPLGVRDRKTLVLQLNVAEAQATTVDVKEKIDLISNDAAQGTPLGQNYISDLPLNGQNAESLVLMTPGITSSAGGTNPGDGGINANGLRSNTNYYTVDGVSLNTAIGAGGGGFGGGGGRGGGGGGFGGGGGGGGLAPGAGGATEIMNVDAMQEMNVQTAPIAPEFGRSPGAQIAMTSRGGSSNFHGSLYYYFRNQKFDANDWFANSLSLARGAERENRPGGTFGGPIIKGKTFFFAQYDQLHVVAPYTDISNVPSVTTRASTSAPLQPFLNAFPIPNGISLIDGAAQYQAVITNPAKTETASLRLDQIISGKTTLFVRYSVSPSSSSRRGSEIVSPNIVTDQSSHSSLVTAGLGHIFENGMVNDLRLNYSWSSASSVSMMDNWGGAVPLTAAEVFPSGYTTANASFNLNMLGVAGYSYGGRTANQQQQVNVVDSITKVVRQHHEKAGIDIRRILVTTDRVPYTEGVSFNGIALTSYSLTSGSALNAVVSSSLPAVYPTYLNFSAYGQDTWRMTERTTFTYGIRWDVNPAPTAREGPKPFALANNQIAGVTQNDPIYPTKWWDLAPRFGLAYEMNTTPGYETMFRGGVGLFYDLGYGTTAGAFSGAPYQSVTTISEAQFPLLPIYLAAPALPPTRPYGQITTAALGLTTPYIWEWNVTMEQHFGSGAVLSAGYAATRGENLMRVTTSPSYSDAFDIVSEATNGASSTYNGMQLQFRKRLSDRLQTQFSYTWSHSIDTASSDGGGGGFATLYGGGQRGDSDYDIRQNLSFSGTYRLPAPSKGLLYAPLRHWYLDFVESARTGLPFDLQTISSNASGAVSINGTTVTTVTNTNGDVNSTVGLFAQVRPNYDGSCGNPLALVACSVWVPNPNVPGGRELNSLAFDIVTGFQQGNLGRNVLRGFGMQQLDLGVRREIPIAEKATLVLSAQAFNVFNHPNFANPSPLEGANLSSPNFGVVTEMLNQSFGGAVNSLFRSGGPRTLELVIRVRF